MNKQGYGQVENQHKNNKTLALVLSPEMRYDLELGCPPQTSPFSVGLIPI
jgi:hypothetical protein